MKKILLTFIGLLAVLLTANGGTVEKSYTLKFLSKASDSSTAMTTSTALSGVLDAASLEYVSGIIATNNAYPNSVNGIKFSSSKANGAVTFALSGLGQVKVSKVELEWAKYGSDA